MLNKLCIFCLIIALCPELYALERGDCTPIVRGNVSDSKIRLDCSRNLPIGAKQKLEELLNAKFTGNEEGECSSSFKGQVEKAEIILICGYPIKDVQKLIDGFLIDFQNLKNRLNTLQITGTDTEKLQEEVDQAIDAGEFEQARTLIDQIIAEEEAAGQKVLEQIKALREVFKNSQEDKAQAGRDAGGVMIEQLQCETATYYYQMADESIEYLSANSLQSDAEIKLYEPVLAAKVKACQRARSLNDKPLGDKAEPFKIEKN